MRFHRKSLAIVTLIAAALLLLASIPGLHPQDWLVQRWEAEVASRPDSEVSEWVEAIAGQGDAYDESLVRLLQSSRSSVREAAMAALREKLKRWKLADTERGWENLRRLIQLLNDQFDQLPGTSKRFAATVCVEGLVWPDGEGRQQNITVVTMCERMIREAGVALQRPAVERSAAPDGLPIPRLPDPLAAALDTPGGNLGHEPIFVTSLPVTLRMPELVPLPLEVDESELSPIPPQRLRPDNPLPLRPTPTTDREQAVSPSPGLGPGRAETVSFEESHRGKSLVATMRQLHAGDADVVLRAEEHLRNSGFSTVEIEIARRAVHPNSAVRRELVSRLTRQPVDVSRWLDLVSNDADREVRRMAYAIMATSGNASLQSLLRRRLAKEVDTELAKEYEQRSR